MATRIVKAQSGHNLFVKEILFSDLPEVIRNGCGKKYTKFYVVKNWDDKGIIFFYLGKGHIDSPKQIVVWYSTGTFWVSYGTTFKEAIDGAQRDGWMLA